LGSLDLSAVLNGVGVFSDDVVMIHGDAGVAAQFLSVQRDEQLNHLMNEIVEFAGTEGTVVVPTFSYSFTKQQDFDVRNTPGDIGLFSEAFRKLPIALRSKNPNFSVASIGRYAMDFRKARIDDAFGVDTAFDLLHKLKGKIVCLGCEFNRVTFVHYLEQSIGVPYRYFKTFSGEVLDEKSSKFINARYYVRDLDLDKRVDLDLLKERGVDRGLVSIGTFGRFPVFSIGADDFYALGTELLSENPYALVNH